MKSHQQSPRSHSRRNSPRKSQRSGPFKSLRHISSGMFSDDRRTLRKPPTARNGRQESTTKDPFKPKPKARKGLSQMLGWKQDQGPSEVPSLPPVPSAFAAESRHALAPQTRPRPSAGPDPFMPSAGTVTMLPAGSTRSRTASASARAMTAERHGSTLPGNSQTACSPVGSSWIHSLTEYDVPFDGSTSNQPLSAEELPSRFSSLRDVIRPRTPPASQSIKARTPPPVASSSTGRRSFDKEKTRSKIWKAISHRSRRSTLKHQNGADDHKTLRDNVSRPSSYRHVSPQRVPAIRVIRPSTGTKCGTPSVLRRRQKSQTSIRSETRNKTTGLRQHDDVIGAHRPLPKRKSLAGLFGVALKKSSEVLGKTSTPPVTTPHVSPTAMRRTADTIDGAGHHFMATSAGFQALNMSDTSPDTAAFFSRVGGRRVDNPRVIRSERSIEDVSAATGHLDRLVHALGQLSPTKRRQSSSPESKKTWSDSWKRASLRARTPTASPTSARFRTPLSLAPQSPGSGPATPETSPSLQRRVRDFMPSPARSPVNKLRQARHTRLSVVHEQDEKLRPSSSTFRSRLSNAPSTAATLIKSYGRAGDRSRDGSIVIGMDVGTSGPDIRSLRAPVAPCDVSSTDNSPPAGARPSRRASDMFRRSDELNRASLLYPREASSMRRPLARPMSTTLSAGDRNSFDFTTELADLETGTDRISFMQALEQSRTLDGMFGLTTAVEHRNKVTKCSPSIVNPSESEVSLPQLASAQPKDAATYRRKPKSSTAPFAGQPSFSLPRPTVTWAPPQVPLPPLPPVPRAERPNSASHHKQPSGFSFMSLSSLGEPLEGVYREGQPTFERNYEGISDPPKIDMGSRESLADLHSLLDRADRSLQRQQSSSKRQRQTSTSTTDSHLLDPQTIMSMLQPASRQTSMQSMGSRMHQVSSSTLASVNEAEISVVTGPPVDLRRHRQAPSVYSIRGSKESSSTVVPSPTRGTRARYPSDASSAFSHGRMERPTLGDRMFDRDDDYMFAGVSPVSPEAALGFRSFQERERRHLEDLSDSHPYSAEYLSRAQRAQASAVTIDLGKPYNARQHEQRRDQRAQASSSTFDLGNCQYSQPSTSNTSCRASDSSDHTIRLSVSLPRVFHSRESSVSSLEEPYGGALDHYLEESPLTTISDRFTAALNAQGKGGPPRTSVLRPKVKSTTRRHRPPRLHLAADKGDNESLPDLVSPGDTSTDVSSLFSLETRNSIPPSGAHPQGRVSSGNIDVQPTIREESSFGTIRPGSPPRMNDSGSPRQLGTLDWEPEGKDNGLPTFMPSSYHDIQLFLAQSQNAYRPLDQSDPGRALQKDSTATNRLSSDPYSRANVPPPETRYRNMRSNSDGDTNLPTSSLLAHFARDSQIYPNPSRSLEEGRSSSPLEESSFRSSVTDSTRRRNLGWRRKRHSEDVAASISGRRRSPFLSASDTMIQRPDDIDASRDRKPSTASVASPLPTFIAFSPPAPPKHGSFPSRRIMVDANGSPYAGWEDSPMASLRARSRDSSPLKHVSSKRSLQRDSDARQPLGSLWSHTNTESKSKIPLPTSKSQNRISQQSKVKGRSKPKTPKMVPLKHQALPTRRGNVDKENVMPNVPVARSVPRLM